MQFRWSSTRDYTLSWQSQAGARERKKKEAHESVRVFNQWHCKESCWTTLGIYSLSMAIKKIILDKVWIKY